MRKVTNQNVVAINSLMLATIASYINTFAKDNDELSNLQMYTSDVVHNIAALDIFNKTKNAQKLHDSIMYQDTLVREYFINTLVYLEENELVPAHCFCVL